MQNVVSLGGNGHGDNTKSRHDQNSLASKVGMYIGMEEKRGFKKEHRRNEIKRWRITRANP